MIWTDGPDSDGLWWTATRENDAWDFDMVLVRLFHDDGTACLFPITVLDSSEPYALADFADCRWQKATMPIPPTEV